MIARGMLRKFTIGVASAMALTMLPVYSVKILRKTDYSDFDVYYRAAQRARAGKIVEIYDYSKDGSSPYRYAPPVIPAFIPFSLLRHENARVAWFYFQYLCYLFGFVVLMRCLQLCRADVFWVGSLTFLLVARFCADSFTIGQISGSMFLLFALSLWAWMLRKSALASAALFGPAFLKVGPACVYPLFFTGRAKSARAAVSISVALAALSLLATFLWTDSFSIAAFLWKQWTHMLTGESEYFDPSHYGSQSVLSALLRLAKAGVLAPQAARWVSQAIAAGACSAMVAFWVFRRPSSPRGRGLFFSMGILAYLWFMPETFKYSQPFLAFPLAMLLCRSRKQDRGLDAFDRAGLILVAATLSMAGLDFVGPTIFFGIQKLSIPLLASLWVGASVTKHAYRESVPSTWSRIVRQVLLRTPLWDRMPAIEPELRASALVPLPMGQWQGRNAGFAKRTLSEIQAFMSRRYGPDHEILLVPTGSCMSEHHPVLQAARQVFGSDPRARFLSSPPILGRGRALQAAFLESRGANLHVFNVERPCGTEFYERSSRLLDEGYDIVWANRRLPDSEFEIPVRILPLIYRRYRLGERYNRWMRRLFPSIRTLDTQSGAYSLGRKLALRAFAIQHFPFIMFDLELCLIAFNGEYKRKELPVKALFEEEKLHIQIVFECLCILRAILSMFFRNRAGAYQSIPAPSAITSDDWGISPGVNEGILALARERVVRRVSALATGAYLERGLSELSRLPGIEIGLHFNLTYGEPLSQGPGSRLLPEGKFLRPGRFLLAYATSFGTRKRQWKELVRAELIAQLDRLEKAGVMPRYLDGHHHIHLVPGLIDAVGDILRARGISRVRLPYDRRLWLSAKFPIALLSVLARPAFRRQGLTYGTSVYPSARHLRNYGALKALLGKAPEAEIIVHPAATDDFARLRIEDPYTQGRVHEFRALRMLRVEWADC